jgi:hypothetical protein
MSQSKTSNGSNASKKTISEVDRVFSEGTNALYLVVQMICPECNKLVRLMYLGGKGKLRKLNP